VRSPLTDLTAEEQEKLAALIVSAQGSLTRTETPARVQAL
jgi:hypothetical protein